MHDSEERGFLYVKLWEEEHDVVIGRMYKFLGALGYKMCSSNMVGVA